VKVEVVQADLSTRTGVDQLYARVKQLDRLVDALFANAGRGLGKGFLDQDFEEIQRVINTNVSGTVYLLHKLVNDMRERGQGRVLITGSVAGFMPGTYQAVYNASKSFVQSFAEALREELKDTDLTITALMPGPTDTNFFERAEMMDTKIGQSKKMDPADVARIGFEAMLKGEGRIYVENGNRKKRKYENFELKK